MAVGGGFGGSVRWLRLGGSRGHIKRDGRDGGSPGRIGGGSLRVHFIDVGQADSILIEGGEAAMLVDAGKNEDGEAVVSYVRAQGIERLDYVIGTHPHEDHIGGLDTVIRNLDVGEVLLPDKIHTTQTFEDVLDAVEEKGLLVTAAAAGDTYPLGEAQFTVLGPNADYGDNLNNWSVGIRLVCGETSFVLTGDAEVQAEEDMLAAGYVQEADVWKAAHHGSGTSNSAAMLDAVQPDYAVISCGEGNSYGHPDASVTEAFAARGIEVFRTDQQGTIVIASDGRELSVQCEREAEETPDVSEEAPTDGESAGEAAGGDAVLVHITESGEKYHRAGCGSLSKSDIEVTLEEAKKRGFAPCGTCRPEQ